MAVPDNISVFTGGWFQSDAAVPNQVEVFSDGWFNILAIAAWVDELAGNVILTLSLTKNATITEALTKNAAITESLTEDVQI